MRRYIKTRTVEDIKKIVEEKFWWINTDLYEKEGNDHIVIGWYNGYYKYGKVLYNTFNGCFTVYDQKNNIVANHLSEELDNEAWYREILDVFYIAEQPIIHTNPTGLNLQI